MGQGEVSIVALAKHLKYGDALMVAKTKDNSKVLTDKMYPFNKFSDCKIRWEKNDYLFIESTNDISVFPTFSKEEHKLLFLRIQVFANQKRWNKDDYRKNKVATSVNDQGEDERFSHYGTGLVNPMPKGEINKLKEIDYGGKDLSEFQTTKNARPDFSDVEDETTFFIAPLLK